MGTRFDLLIVGAGLFGATCAYELQRRGFRCLIIEKRGHIGGNCFTENRDGINIHKYGPHIFHTSNRAIWEWINQFVTFNHYRHRVVVNSNGSLYSFPLNLLTFYQLWGIRTPAEAKARLQRERTAEGDSTSAESWLISNVGRELYETFFKGYTEKQWGRPASELPASIVKRLPIRFSFDDAYFEDPHQGIPVGGYTAIFSKLLSDVEVRLNTDYFSDRKRFDSLAKRVLYTGPMDRFFDYKFGRLAYRSMRFEHSLIETPDYQGISTMNYASREVPFTRIVEHKHFEFGKQPVTWITKEYSGNSGEGREPMYPVKDLSSQCAWENYKSMTQQPEYQKYHFGGRLAAYQYYDMHQVIGAALAKVGVLERELLIARSKNHEHCSSQREEAQIFGPLRTDQSLLTSAATNHGPTAGLPPGIERIAHD